MAPPELAVVVPVYNEEAAAERVLRGWLRQLDALGIDYELHACDDGSTDGTGKLLAALACEHPRLRVRAGENRGHGPTILRGYRENAGTPWIFQVDSDDEMRPDSFPQLWRRRGDYDLLLGERARQAQPWLRRCVSAGSRLVVWALFGRAVRDVNAPYRLMRSACFRGLYEALPEDTFAPNLVVSGLAALRGLRVFRWPVEQRPRRSGEVSLRRLGLLRAAATSLLQTAAARLALARRP